MNIHGCETMGEKLKTFDEIRELYPTDEQMNYFNRMGTGKEELPSAVMDLLEMVWQEMKKDIDTRMQRGPWNEVSPVVRAYTRYQNGERPE